MNDPKFNVGAQVRSRTKDFEGNEAIRKGVITSATPRKENEGLTWLYCVQEQVELGGEVATSHVIREESQLEIDSAVSADA